MPLDALIELGEEVVVFWPRVRRQAPCTGAFVSVGAGDSGGMCLLLTLAVWAVLAKGHHTRGPQVAVLQHEVRQLRGGPRLGRRTGLSIAECWAVAPIEICAALGSSVRGLPLESTPVPAGPAEPCRLSLGRGRAAYDLALALT